MVRAHDVHLDKSVPDPIFKSGTDEEIIQAPADVAIAGATFLIPPGVLAWLKVELTEGINETTGDKAVQKFPLDGHKAGHFNVLFGAGDIDLLVRGIEVAANDHLTSFGDPGQIGRAHV